MTRARARRAAVAAAAVGLAAACAGPRREAGAGAIEGEPQPIVASPSEPLASKSAEELFAIGSAAYAAGEDARAAEAFGRAADLFPSFPRRAAALYDAGLALRNLGAWRPALERFRELSERYVGPDADEARFLAAEAHWRLGERDAARSLLDALAARSDLDAQHHARALVERGVVEVEDGATDAGERSLEAGARALDEARERERVDPALLAKARWWLGEVDRLRFAAVRVDPGAEAGRIERDLEAKSQLLLAAQARYAAAARDGDAAWKVASGARIGELYEAFHDELVSAPAPRELDADAARTYAAELRGRVRALVTKAIEAYEETLATARRTGAGGDLVPGVEAGLARMRRALAEADAAPPPPAPPTG